MSYDANQLKALRDNIDMYLSRAQEEDMRIYETLEKSISNAVKEGLEPIVRELKEAIENSKQFDTTQCSVIKIEAQR